MDIVREIERVIGEFYVMRYPEPVVVEYSVEGVSKVIRIAGEARSVRDGRLAVRLEEEAFRELIERGYSVRDAQ